MRAGNSLASTAVRTGKMPSERHAMREEQRYARLALHLEILAAGWVCGFAAGAGLAFMILR
jgi:hypothetical protein